MADKVLLDRDPQAMEYVRSLGHTQAPVIVLRDEDQRVVEHWSGFSIDRMTALADRVAA